MNPPGNKLPWTIGVGFLLVLVTVALLVVMAGITSRVRPRSDLPVISQIPEFTLTNQMGAAVTPADLSNHVWVADIIFTRCAGPCPAMTQRMQELQEALPAGSQARLVTLTTDPGFDTPEIMHRYAERFGATEGRWLFLTGSKEEIVRVAVDGLKLIAVETDPEQRAAPADLFIHSTTFVIVDKRGRLRGSFETDGEGVDWSVQKQKILTAIRQLERES